MTAKPMRIAMWSGPRNISTAMMRSWGSRRDTIVIDEPLYAHYLKQTKLPHPGADEIIEHHPHDLAEVIAMLFADLPAGKHIFYQKHMAHHLLPDMDTAWVDQLTNCLLIREPRAMLLSLSRVIDRPAVSDTGLPQQWALFEQLRATGHPPPVVDARDILLNPAGMLAALCETIGVEFDDAMLSWSPGPRDTDGIWAKYWYDAVNASTGFEPYRERNGTLPDELEEVCRACDALYEELYTHRLVA